MFLIQWTRIINFMVRRIEMKAIVNANIVLPNGILWDGVAEKIIDKGKELLAEMK